MSKTVLSTLLAIAVLGCVALAVLLLKSHQTVYRDAVLAPSGNQENTEKKASQEHAQLHGLFNDDWEFRMDQSPTWASMLGDRRANDRWPDISPKAIELSNMHDKAMLSQVEKIDRSKLSPEDQLNYDLFKHGKEQSIERFGLNWHLIALNQRGGIQTEDDLADALRFDTIKDYEDWIARLKALPGYITQTQALLQEGIAKKMLLPKVIMNRIPTQIDKQITATPEDSPFFKAFREFDDSIPAADQTRLTKAATEAISKQIIPAYQTFKEFFVSTYLPACPTDPGAWNLPNGEAMYAFFARSFTTTDMTPDQIHEIGLSEVKRIRAQMETVRETVGFEGDLAAFFDHLRTDPKYFCKNGAELLATYESVSKKIDPLMVHLFKNLPRTPYGVQPIPQAVAPDTTTAYYRRPAADGSRAGAYFVNLYKPETRPKWEMMALSLHEAVPGHHLQIALAMEQGELPNFRRYQGYTAYIEGWGLYSEFLGEELGLYEDPYDKFGQLTYEMWRAVRLVVDTGIHHKKWPRQKAIDFFMENAPKSKLDITNEIDRYIAWPGQALAYKIGELKMKELRVRATKALGEKFDIKDFHHVVLNQGAVPLNVLERNVDAWIAATK